MQAPTVSLLEGARIIARGGDLDSKLQALAAYARSASDTQFVALFLFDIDGQMLVGAAADGSGGEIAAPEPIDAASTHPALKRALASRRPAAFAHGADGVESLSFLPADARTVFVVPLVSDAEDGSAAVDGLVIASTGTATDEVPDSLVAVADLAAVAIRQTRLENALNERADWLDRMANTDALTGLANRRTFDRMLELELARAGRQGVVIGLAVFAIDGLAETRKRDGDGAADDQLRKVAAILAEQLRLVDTVARFGDDSFASICPGSPGPEAARRVRDAVSKAQPTDGAAAMHVSAGLASFPATAATADTLVAAAETALLKAKSEGPGSVVESGSAAS